MGLIAQALGSSTSETPDWIKALATRNVAAPPESPGGSGPLGFLQNLVGDVGEFTGGLANIAKAVGADVFHALPGTDDTGYNYVTDDIVTNLIPGTIDYVKQNYLSGLDKLGQHAYENPLFFATDILSAGTGIGAVRGAAAKQAAKAINPALTELGSVEKTLASALRAGAPADRIAELQTRVASLTTPQAARVLRVHPGAARQAYDLSKGASVPYALGGEGYRVFGQGGDPLKIAENLGRVTYSANPFRRSVHKGVEKLLTSPVEKYAGNEGAVLGEALHELNPLVAGDPDLANVLRNQARVEGSVVEAARRLGVERIDRPWVADLKLRGAVDKMFGDYGSRFYRARNQRKLEIEEIILKNPELRAWPKERRDAFINQELHKMIQTGGGKSLGRLDDFTELLDDDVPDMDLQTQRLLEEKLGWAAVDADDPRVLVASSWQEVGHPVFAQKLQAKGFRVIDQSGPKITLGLPDGRQIKMFHLPKEGVGFIDEFKKLMDPRDLVRKRQMAENTLAKIQAGARITRSEVRALGEQMHSWIKGKLPKIVDDEVAIEEAEKLLRYVENETEARRLMAADLSESYLAMEAAGRGVFRDGTPFAAQDHLAKLQADLRWWVHRTMTRPALDGKYLPDIQTVLNRAFLPWKLDNLETVRSYKDALARIATRPDIPEDAKMRAAMLQRWGLKDKWDMVSDEAAEALDDLELVFPRVNEMHAAGLQTPVYFPHIDTTKVKHSDWLTKRATIGMEQLAGKAGLQKSTGSLYLHGRYVTDPIDAYARRAAQITRTIETHELVNQVAKTLGRRIDSHHDVIPETEMLWAPVVGKMRAKLEVELLDIFSDDIAALKGRSDEVVQSFVETMQKFYGDETNIQRLTEMLEALGTGSIPGGVELYAIPKIAADRLTAFGKYHVGGSFARMFWEGPTNLWRSAVLTFSPRWIVNNTLGNIVFLKLQGGKFRDALQAAIDKDFRAAINKAAATLDPRSRASLAGGLFMEQPETALGRAESTAIGTLMTKAKESRAGRSLRHAGEFMHRLNTHSEEWFRSASYLTGIERQLAQRGVKLAGKSFHRSFRDMEKLVNAGMDEVVATRALESVNYFFNDYSRLGPFERGVLRRFIVPFWGFYKHVARLAATYPGVDPARAAVLSRMAELTGEMDADLGMIPEFLKSSTMIGERGEDELFLNTRGANPFDILADPWAAVVGGANPLVRGVLNYATGRRLDQAGQPQYQAPDVAAGGNYFYPFGSERQYEVVAGPDGQPQLIPAHVRPELSEMLFQNFPQAELVRDVYDARFGEGIGPRWSATGDVRIDPETGAPQGADKPLLLETLKMLGISVTPYDLDKFQEHELANIQAGLNAYFRAQGVIPPTEQTEEFLW